MGDDGLHHLTPCIPPGLVAITLTGAVTIVIISVRQVTKQKYSLRIVTLQPWHSQARSYGKELYETQPGDVSFHKKLDGTLAREHTMH